MALVWDKLKKFFVVVFYVVLMGMYSVEVRKSMDEFLKTQTVLEQYKRKMEVTMNKQYATVHKKIRTIKITKNQLAQL
jgi:hypothetical protein